MVELPPTRLAKHSQTPDAYASRANATSSGLSIVRLSTDKSHALQDDSRRHTRPSLKGREPGYSLQISLRQEFARGNECRDAAQMAGTGKRMHPKRRMEINHRISHILSSLPRFRNILRHFGWRSLTRSEHAPSVSMLPLLQLGLMESLACFAVHGALF